jgi:hypothetical protein
MVARHFLCCLPLRLGALLISACQLALVGLLAAGSWYTVTSLRTFPNASLLSYPLKPMVVVAFFLPRTGGRLPNNLRGVIVSNAIYFTLLSLTAVIGCVLCHTPSSFLTNQEFQPARVAHAQG